MSKHFMNVKCNVRNRIAVRRIRENANKTLSKWIACDNCTHTLHFSFENTFDVHHQWEMVDKPLEVFFMWKQMTKKALKQLID